MARAVSKDWWGCKPNWNGFGRYQKEGVKIETAVLKHSAESREMGWKMERGEDSRGLWWVLCRTTQISPLDEGTQSASSQGGLATDTTQLHPPQEMPSAEGSCLQTVHRPSILCGGQATQGQKGPALWPSSGLL